MIPPTALPVLALCMAGLAAVLALLVVVTKTSRQLRERSAGAAAAPHRRALVVVGTDEDDDGAGMAHLLGVDRRSWRSLAPAVVAMLSKVRGKPAQDLGQVLRAHGDVDHARADLRSRSVVSRARAAYLLGLVKDPAHVADLLPLLSDRSAEVRHVAVRALGAIGDPRAAPGVLDALLPVRGRVGVPADLAAEALLSMGVGAASAVRDGLFSHDPVVRNVSAMVAGQNNLSSVAARLRELLRVDHDLDVRKSCAEALGLVGGTDDVDELARHTEASEPPTLRRACAAALGELGDPGATDVLLGLLPDSDRRLAEVAAHALIRLGPVGMARLEAVRGDGSAARVARAVLVAARLPDCHEAIAG
ncbi:MAG TPA: HEAT repeat domain-containing protein [Dermatophilaceae bacterium]|nr:HEAT repeat domain-containing protein [Dermatophilaceae bacterium]